MARRGISSCVEPWSSRPPALGVRPPHCLKKNGIPAAAHWSRRSISHASSTGRAPGPLSPPAISQSIPARSSSSRGPRSGSALTNRTAASTRRRWSRRKRYLEFSTLTPIHRFGRPLEPLAHVRKSPRTLGKHLVLVPRRVSNHIEDPMDVGLRHLLVEQVTHRVDKDRARARPRAGNIEGVGVDCESEAGAARPRIPVSLVFCLSHRLQPLGQRQGVAVVTARRCLVATRRRVPRGLCPLDRALVPHSWLPVSLLTPAIQRTAPSSGSVAPHRSRRSALRSYPWRVTDIAPQAENCRSPGAGRTLQWPSSAPDASTPHVARAPEQN